MLQWLGYGLADLVIYSPRAYSALVQAYNQAVWPLHLLAAALMAAIAVLLCRRTQRGLRICMVLLAACWLWTAIAFLLQRYSTLHWAAGYMALAFTGQALWLLLMALLPAPGGEPWRLSRIRNIGWAIFVAGIIAPFALILYQGKPWMQLEMPGLMPDPTAIATLGALLLARGKMVVPASIIPLAWCAYSGSLRWAMSG